MNYYVPHLDKANASKALAMTEPKMLVFAGSYMESGKEVKVFFGKADEWTHRILAEESSSWLDFEDGVMWRIEQSVVPGAAKITALHTRQQEVPQ